MEGTQGDEMKCRRARGTFHSLPGAFRGSKDASESEEGMQRWGQEGAALAAGQNTGGGGRPEGRAGSQREAEEAVRRLTR